jgi:MOSC domain-containing protein YiiM
MHATMPTLRGIFIGDISLLDPEGHRTGIFKRPVATGHVTATGLEGDHQADLRVHGGPEKALHHYAAEHYAHLVADYPALAGELVPGSLGENLSTLGWSEDNVYIGDVFQVEGTILQVSQPRSPCWKINHRFGIDDLSQRIAAGCSTGWYYRVLAPGRIAVGNAFERVAQAPDPVSIRRFWEIVLCHRPRAEDLDRLCGIPALTVGWKRKLGERKAWLDRNASR